MLKAGTIMHQFQTERVLLFNALHNNGLQAVLRHHPSIAVLVPQSCATGSHSLLCIDSIELPV